MSVFLVNVYGENTDPKAHYQKLDQTRNNVYAYDKTILENHVGDYEQFDFNGKFDYFYKGIKLQCLFINNSSNKLLISYNGARENIRTTETKYFFRWSYYKIIEGCYLGIDDPMYLEYPELKLGWFYGNKNMCYIDNTIKLIEKICVTKNINLSDCTFFSSSGGGYASILGAIAIPGSLSISINPQIYIEDWPYSKKFEEIVGVKLSEYDPLLRNDLAKKIKYESHSKHVILVNILSEHDYRDVLKLCNEFGATQLRYGLNIIAENLLIWIYEAIPNYDSVAHKAQDNKQIFKFIEFISYKFKNDNVFLIDNYQKLVIAINEIWYEYSRVSRLYNNAISTNCVCDFYLNTNIMFQNIVKEYKELYLSPKDTNYNFFIHRFPTNDSKYTVVIENIYSNTEQYTYGLYDFSLNKFIKRFDVNVTDTQIINFSFKFVKVTNIGLIIYAGIVGKTKNNYLKIKKMTIYSM